MTPCGRPPPFVGFPPWRMTMIVVGATGRVSPERFGAAAPNRDQ